jgi:PKD repeat protein
VFNDQSTGNITSYYWDFGDGTTSTLKNPTHIYTTPGTYTVTETVTGPGGNNTITGTNVITVFNSTAPNVTATPNNGIYNNNQRND